MSRPLSIVFGPELVLAVLGVGVFWFCARHNSGEGRDVAVLERSLMLLPLIVVPLAFATVALPGAKNWWWLGRAIVFTYLMLLICAGRIITGFGSGAKGQDAAFIIVVVFATLAIALAATVTGATVLAETKPAFANWFRERKILGSLLVLLASVPVGVGLGLIVTFAIGVFAAAYSAIKA